MGYVKSNAMPLVIGVAVGMFVMPYVMNMIKNRAA